jgi:hypothetical protein
MLRMPHRNLSEPRAANSHADQHGSTLIPTVLLSGDPLQGSEFTGQFFDLSGTLAQGQLFSIQSTGTHNRATRTTEVVFQSVPESFKSGYTAFNGAELAWKIHNCDYFWFTYDPQVRCTRFLPTSNGTPEIVSYREVR